MISQSILVMGRLAKEPAVHTTAALASVPAAAAGLHAVGVSTEVNSVVLANGLLDTHLWIILGMAALFGGIGGVVAELLSLHGNIELPHRHQLGPKTPRQHRRRSKLAHPEHEIDLGIVSRLLLGSTAALASLALFAPQNPMLLVANALIAGSAATGVFRLVQGRMLGKSSAKDRSPTMPEKPQLSFIGAAQTAGVGGAQTAAAQ
jgi:hypothetical protein